MVCVVCVCGVLCVVWVCCVCVYLYVLVCVCAALCFVYCLMPRVQVCRFCGNTMQQNLVRLSHKDSINFRVMAGVGNCAQLLVCVIVHTKEVAKQC